MTGRVQAAFAVVDAQTQVLRLLVPGPPPSPECEAAGPNQGIHL
jgi:hypothetical protein